MVFETDPVCHMKVMPETAAAQYEYQGKTYYFCNPRCLERFQENPEQYLAASEFEGRTPNSEVQEFGVRPSNSADLKGIYVCPMDAEVRQVGPGICPKCGMALEPE